jgi:hypothetical protein
LFRRIETIGGSAVHELDGDGIAALVLGGVDKGEAALADRLRHFVLVLADVEHATRYKVHRCVGVLGHHFRRNVLKK